jgi:DNA-nicking Smr family endonuclease
MPPPRPLQHLADERAALNESLHGQISLQDRLEGGDEPSYLRIGLASSILLDLRRGRWVTQDEIDLHGLNRDEARQLLAAFLAESLHWGKRCVRDRSWQRFAFATENFHSPATGSRLADATR